MSPDAESFLDEIITWHEIGYNFASHCDDYDKYESLPDWVQRTLRDHSKDEREHLYTLEEFESAKPTILCGMPRKFNWCAKAASTITCACCGGKKILQWTRSPQEAAEIMIHLDNKYGLDGLIQIPTAAFSGCLDATTVRGLPFAPSLALCAA